MSESHDTLRVGFAGADLTPPAPVLISGQFHARVSEGVKDPITATAMAFESIRPGAAPVRGVMVSCDLVCISDALCEQVRGQLRERLPELDPMCVILNATHTHTGPETRPVRSGGCIPPQLGIDPRELGVMPAADYVALAAGRIVAAVIQAWTAREPAGIGFGLAHATIGYNRRICYYSGETRMYGQLNDAQFSHVEGGAETGINVLCVWNRRQKLTGVVVNLPCPSQVDEHEFQLSADYWHEARQELRQRLGPDLFILPQVSAAGDVTPPRPTTVPDWKALERMWRLKGIDQRRDIGQRIANAVASVVEVAARDVDWNPITAHRIETVALPLRALTEHDVEQAMAEAAQLEPQYEALRQELEANPRQRQQPRWYVKITHTYRRMMWNRQVAQRYEQQQHDPSMPVEVHVLRLGDIAFATNRFEYYQDFGLQIKARSKALQTFIVQLAGPGTYLPTARAAAGKSYGAVPASTPVGPEGGRKLVDWTVEAIEALWAQ
jgi:hypothetical protein